MRFLRRQKPLSPPMPLEKSLETAALLAKHMRTFTPSLALLFGNPKPGIRREVLQQIGERVAEDVELRADLAKIITNLLGEEADVAALPTLFPRLLDAWRANRMERLFQICFQIGILDRADLANWLWVKTAMRKKK